MFSKSDLALIDETTNHMDYIAKEKFIKWLRSTKLDLILISHDRDVLKAVDQIIELKANGIQKYDGNYDDYVRINTKSAVEGNNEFETDLMNIKKTKSQILYTCDMKRKAKSNKGRNAAKIREIRKKDNLSESLSKPSL